MSCATFKIIFLILTTTLTCYSMAHKTYVCKTFKDYNRFPPLNKNCYYNPDIDLSVPDIIHRHGYPVETHYATTRDGYILTVYRIPYGRWTSAVEPHPPVFLQHGLALNCGIYVNRGNKSLAFILADAGYDVWLGNFRGNAFSKNHTHLHTHSPRFWDFAIDHHGLYDLPAQLNVVSQHNNRKIIYIGFSMGTTSVFMYSSSFPNEAFRKLKVIICLSPVAYLYHMESVARFLAPFRKILEVVLVLISNGKIPFRQPKLIKLLCLTFPFQLNICMKVLGFLLGRNPKELDPETLPISLLQDTDSPSARSVSQYGQFYLTNRFSHYNYGVIGNIVRYGRLSPPKYNLGYIKVPIHMLSGHNDYFSTTKDLKKLNHTLSKESNIYPIYFVNDEDFTHMDFVIAKNVVPKTYDHLLKFLQTL